MDQAGESIPAWRCEPEISFEPLDEICLGEPSALAALMWTTARLPLRKDLWIRYLTNYSLLHGVDGWDMERTRGRCDTSYRKINTSI